MGAQWMAAEGCQVVRGGCRSDAGRAIAYDHDIAFAVDRQIEQSDSGCLVVNGFDAGKLAREPDDGFGCGVAAAVDANEAAERPVMRHEIVGDRTDHRCCGRSELEIERVLEPYDPGRAVGVGLVAHSMIRDETEDRKSTRLNSSHLGISYAVFCLKKKTK